MAETGVSFLAMNITFEQPRHLNSLSYQRHIRALRPMLLVFGATLTAFVLLALRYKAHSGQQISGVHWVLGATTGGFAVGLMWLTLRFEASIRRWVELGDKGFLLAKRGFITDKRLIAWSLTPESLEPR